MMGDNDFQYGHMNNGAGWLIALLLMLILIAAVALLVIYLVRSTSAPAVGQSAPSDAGQARRILDERLARGEIDSAEYRDRRAALNE